MSRKTVFAATGRHFGACKLDIVPVSSSGYDLDNEASSIDRKGIDHETQSPIRLLIRVKQLILADQTMPIT